MSQVPQVTSHPLHWPDGRRPPERVYVSCGLLALLFFGGLSSVIVLWSLWAFEAWGLLINGVAWANTLL